MSAAEGATDALPPTAIHVAQLTTRDGVVLAMDLHFPGGGPQPGRRYPVVVERTPYGRRLERIRDFGVAAAARGYVFVAQDVRGRGQSGGHFHMLTNVPDEGQDGEDTLEWILQQAWCNGDIATVGGSFSAANQQALALRQPRGLRTQILRDGGTNYWRRMLRFHGLFNVGMVLPWVLSQAIDSPAVRSDPEALARLRAMRDDLGGWTRRLPLVRGATPLALAPEYEDIYFTMLETADDVAYWHNPTARLEGRWDEYPRGLSVLLVTGWFAHHAAANFDKLREFGCRLDGPVCLVAGPWTHSPRMLEATHAGEAEFGEAAAALGPVQRCWLDWLDATLAGHAPLALPRVSYFVMGTGDGHLTPSGRYFHGGEWRSSDVWPPAGAHARVLYLHADGSLQPQPADAGTASQYVFDPADPCPGLGGTNQQNEDVPDFIRAGPWDQRGRADFAACRGAAGPLDARADLLAFRSAPLATSVEVTGDLSCVLHVESSAPDTDFIVRLVDEYPVSALHPHGLALLIAEGAVRMRYRGDRPMAQQIEPGQVYEVQIELSPTSNVFKVGHRIRLDITSSSFPGYDVNPNTGEPLGRHTRSVAATQRIHHDAVRRSSLVLSVVGDPGTSESSRRGP